MKLTHVQKTQNETFLLSGLGVFGQKGTEYPSVLHMICGLTSFLLWENLQVSHEIN